MRESGFRGCRLVPALVALVLVLGAGQAGAADSVPEAGPGGPPACSVFARVAAPGGLGLDLWVQCNYSVSEFAVRLAGRRLIHVPVSPELVAPAPGDFMACRRSSPSLATCKGGLRSFARVHMRLTVDEGVCGRPRLRVAVSAFGGPECTGECSAIGFRTLTPGPPSRFWMGCGGR